MPRSQLPAAPVPEHDATDIADGVPEADAIEQSTPVTEPEDDTDVLAEPREVPFDANEADAAEQSRTVAEDEDEYR